MVADKNARIQLEFWLSNRLNGTRHRLFSFLFGVSLSRFRHSISLLHNYLLLRGNRNEISGERPIEKRKKKTQFLSHTKTHISPIIHTSETKTKLLKGVETEKMVIHRSFLPSFALKSYLCKFYSLFLVRSGKVIKINKWLRNWWELYIWAARHAHFPHQRW